MAATIGYEEVAYAVVVTRIDGSKFFATGERSITRLHRTRREALDFADDLSREAVVNRKQMKVVKLQVSARIV